MEMSLIEKYYFFKVLFYILFGLLSVIVFVFFLERKKVTMDSKIREMQNKKKEKIDKKIFQYFLLTTRHYEGIILKSVKLMKLNRDYFYKYYEEGFYFSLLMSVILGFFFGQIAENLYIGIFIGIMVYFGANQIYPLLLETELKKYKNYLSNEVIEMFLIFNLLYPTYNNPTSTLIKIINDNKDSELNRQMEYMIKLSAEKGRDAAIKDIKESIEGVKGLEIFIDLYYNLEKEGLKALQDINNYIGNIISTNELEAEKKINETKSKVEVIMFLVIFTGLVILILAPIFLGKFDGEHNLLYYFNFIKGF